MTLSETAAPWTPEQAARARTLADTPGAVVPTVDGRGAVVRGTGGEYLVRFPGGVRGAEWSCTCPAGRAGRMCYHVPVALLVLATAPAPTAPTPAVGVVLETRCAACAEDVRVRVVERPHPDQGRLGYRREIDGAVLIEVRPGCVACNLPCCGYVVDLTYFRHVPAPAPSTSSAAPEGLTPYPLPTGAAGYPCPRCGKPGAGVLVRSPWEDIPDEVAPCGTCQRVQDRRQEEHLRAQDAARRQRPRISRNAITARRAL